jgi:hypothetical protein
MDPAIKFKAKCDGVYYYHLRSAHWVTPTLRGDRGAYYEYHYLVVLNKELIPFKTNDTLNVRKFASIRNELVKLIGVHKTDSLKPYLIGGYIAR